MHKNILTVVGITILFLGTCITTSIAVDTIKEPIMPISNGKTLYVGGSGVGNYTTIQKAINNAVNGDTVFVYDDSSPYKEHILVHESINLIGENRDTTIIDGGGRKSVVFINAPRVTLSEFTIQNGYTGIHVHYYSWNNTIKNNIILKNVNGILLRTSPDNLIIGNKITNNHIGIDIIGSDYNTILRNNIAKNRFGIFLDFEIGEIEADCANNKIFENNFLVNIIHASFIYLDIDTGNFHMNNWSRNYWGRPRILPKPIFGLVSFIIPWINFDWRPALKPYDIQI